jgi:hypothetical protein
LWQAGFFLNKATIDRNIYSISRFENKNFSFVDFRFRFFPKKPDTSRSSFSSGTKTSKTTIFPPPISLQLEFVGNLRRDLLETDRSAGDPLEPDPVERQPGQLANLDLPLDERVCVGVAVDAEEQEALPLLVVTVVRIEHLQANVKVRLAQGTN